MTARHYKSRSYDLPAVLLSWVPTAELFAMSMSWSKLVIGLAALHPRWVSYV